MMDRNGKTERGQGLPVVMMYGAVGILVALVGALVVFNIGRTLWLGG